MEAHFNIATWVNQSTIYEVNIRQYTPEGTFHAFLKHIPRLKDMGVDVLWLMPITPISDIKKKGRLGSYYACSSYTKINPAFGTEADFLNLITCAHNHGLKVMIDWVANHTGVSHEWMTMHPDWFLRDEEGNFTERNGWEDVVDLNYDKKEMRAAMIGAMQYWVSTFNIDGLRCDMAHLVPLDFWTAARRACDAIKPLFWLAECENSQYHPSFDASYAWDWMHATQKVTAGQVGVNEVLNILEGYMHYPAGALKLYFTSNHDENSWNGNEYEKYGFAAKPWAVFTFTWKGLPLIYSGQELPNLKRLKFFDKDVIEWNEDPALHSFYKTLSACRKKYSALINGATYHLPSQSNGVMAYLRYDDHHTIMIILNVSEQQQKICFSHERISGQFENIFSGLQFHFDKDVTFELLPGDYFVYVKG